MTKYYCDDCDKELTDDKVDIGFSLRRGAKKLHPLMVNISGEKMLCVECAKNMLGKALTNKIAELEKKQAELDAMLNAPKTLDTNIDELNLSVRSFNCLRRANINTLGQILEMSYEELMRIRNLGKHGFDEVQDVAKKYKDLKEQENGQG